MTVNWFVLFCKAQSAPTYCCVLYFKLYVTQQGMLPGVAARTSTFSCVNLPPKQQDFFHCKHPRFTAFITDLPPDTKQVCSGPSLLTPWKSFEMLTFCPASVIPWAQSCFTCFPLTTMGPFSIQTCEIVPAHEAVICKLQDPSITSSQHPVIRAETWHQGVKKGDKIRENIWSLLSSVSQLLSTECLPYHWGPTWIPHVWYRVIIAAIPV